MNEAYSRKFELNSNFHVSNKKKLIPIHTWNPVLVQRHRLEVPHIAEGPGLEFHY